MVALRELSVVLRVSAALSALSHYVHASLNDVEPERDCRCWASQGECTANPDWMTLHCPASCARQLEFESSTETISTLRTQIEELTADLADAKQQAAANTDRQVDHEHAKSDMALEQTCSSELESEQRIQIDDLKAKLEEAHAQSEAVEDLKSRLADALAAKHSTDDHSTAQHEEDAATAESVKDLKLQLENALAESQSAKDMMLQLEEAASREAQDLKLQLQEAQAATGSTEAIRVQLDEALGASKSAREEVAELRARESFFETQAANARVEAENSLETMRTRIAELEAQVAAAQAHGASAGDTEPEADPWVELYEAIIQLPETLSYCYRTTLATTKAIARTIAAALKEMAWGWCTYAKELSEDSLDALRHAYKRTASEALTRAQSVENQLSVYAEVAARRVKKVSEDPRVGAATASIVGVVTLYLLRQLAFCLASAQLRAAVGTSVGSAHGLQQDASTCCAAGRGSPGFIYASCSPGRGMLRRPRPTALDI
eukprot:TRINITY_DN23780_c0_g1_i1.p1 TRINITY_DN23780_c0_g1~~TRINITY_DN23780_c0_g1_i1.p1  ORF type:complete len:493 (+),score=96.63 TRINITY_DN23780_c0_g1_i1:62-1540(+)